MAADWDFDCDAEDNGGRVGHIMLLLVAGMCLYLFVSYPLTVLAISEVHERRMWAEINRYRCRQQDLNSWNEMP
ncbi:hypothetical protein BT63DRAFT_422298, partial [Microthyrium microscopicum]